MVDFGTPRKDRRQYESQESLVTLAWATFAPATDKTPDTDTEIDISLASSISIQIDTTAAANDSDDNDINVESSPDGTNWDTVPFAERNIGDGEIKTFLVEPGPKLIRLRADNNHASDSANISARVLLRSFNAL